MIRFALDYGMIASALSSMTRPVPQSVSATRTHKDSIITIFTPSR